MDKPTVVTSSSAPAPLNWRAPNQKSNTPASKRGASAALVDMNVGRGMSHRRMRSMQQSANLQPSSPHPARVLSIVQWFRSQAQEQAA